MVSRRLRAAAHTTADLVALGVEAVAAVGLLAVESLAVGVGVAERGDRPGPAVRPGVARAAPAPVGLPRHAPGGGDPW